MSEQPKVVDARGLSCPQPVLLTRKAMAECPSGPIEVIVDTGTSRDNVSRMAQRAGWCVSVEALPRGEFRLRLTK